MIIHNTTSTMQKIMILNIEAWMGSQKLNIDSSAKMLRIELFVRLQRIDRNKEIGKS